VVISSLKWEIEAMTSIIHYVSKTINQLVFRVIGLFGILYFGNHSKFTMIMVGFFEETNTQLNSVNVFAITTLI
jgi:hypothetical protein